MRFLSKPGVFSACVHRRCFVIFAERQEIQPKPKTHDTRCASSKLEAALQPIPCKAASAIRWGAGEKMLFTILWTRKHVCIGRQ